MRSIKLFILGIVVCFCSASPPCIAGQNPYVVLETNFGNIVIELYPEAAPVTVENFLSYVNSGFYDGILFHRSETKGRQSVYIDDPNIVYTGTLDVLQAGWVFSSNGTYYGRQAGDPIINESYNGLSNERGTIAMARSTDPDSASAQFFINHQDNTNLDKANYYDEYGYCVFGAIAEGEDVMDAIAHTNIRIFTSSIKCFPDNPPVFINTAYQLPCELSYCSDLAATGRISFEDFAIFSSHWLDDTCDSANGFCSGADLDYSGGVNITDLNLFWNHWTRISGYERRPSDIWPDYKIEHYDLADLMARWLDSSCNPENNYCDRTDINRDGIVDFMDLSLLSSHWQQSY